MRDPIVAEIHKDGEEHACKFNYDLDAICDGMRKREKEPGALAVKLSPEHLATREETPARVHLTPSRFPFNVLVMF